MGVTERVATADSPRRSWLLAGGVYLVTVAVFCLVADPARLVAPTPHNHFALLAESWTVGRLDLGGTGPDLPRGDDFARHDGRWYVVFPPFPALLLVPLVALAGEASRVLDGRFFLALAGIGPAILFLALERLRRSGRGTDRVQDNLALAALFAFGTVYFFTAVQGTVWYAAHVVGVALAALYLWASLDAQHPWLAGVALGLAFLTRAPLLFAFPLFLAEAWRITGHDPGSGGGFGGWRGWWHSANRRRAAHSLAAFAAPLLGALGLAFAYNVARFGHPLEFGYRHLVIAWQPRIEAWGLFHYHYLARNLGVMLTSLPWGPSPHVTAPFQVSGHGLALWVTSPFLLWLARSSRSGGLQAALWWTVIAVALPSLFYQNSGWVQFGYRFSNDFAVFLFALLAVGRVHLGRGFWFAAGIAVVVNAFGALSFGRPAWAAYYHIERTQTVLYQPD